jgi:hypothetical protein
MDAIALNCADYVDSPDDPEVLGYAISGIQEAVDFLNMRLWSWQLRTSGFVYVVGTKDYTFPIGIRAPRHLNNKNGSTTSSVGYLDPKSFFLETRGDDTGEATSYTLMPADNSTSFVRLSHAPTTASVVTYPSGELTYYERITYPANTASGIDVPPEVERVIMDFARVYVAERWDQKKVELPNKRFEVGFRQLRINESLDQSSDWNEGY